MQKNNVTIQVNGKLVGQGWGALTWKGSLKATCDADLWMDFSQKYSFDSRPWHTQIERLEDVYLNITNAPDFEWCKIYDITITVKSQRTNGFKVRHFTPDPDGEYAEYFYHGDFVPEYEE